MSEKTEKVTKTVTPKKTTQVQRVYIGPRINGVTHGTIYTGDLPDYLQNMISELPTIGALVINISELPAANKALLDKESRLSILYRQVEEKGV